MGIITDSGRAFVARAIKEQPLYLAWGSGSPDWGGDRPPEDERSVALSCEIGRKALFRSLFVFPADDGEICVSEESRYAVSSEPTKYLYAEFDFDFKDGAGETIREIGIFIGGKMVDGLPPAQTYFVPSEVIDPGTMLMIEHRETELRRMRSERCIVAYVIPF